MVHNGIEYGLMEAYAEGYELLERTPLVENVPETIKSWTKGTVIRSWLLDLLVRALDADPDLSELRGYAQDSGEGRWTIEAAIENAVPMPVITSALYARFASRQVDSPAMKVVAALRQQFGGHPVDKVGGSGIHHLARGCRYSLAWGFPPSGSHRTGNSFCDFSFRGSGIRHSGRSDTHSFW